MSNYDRFPHIDCGDSRVIRGYSSIITELQSRIKPGSRFVLIASFQS